MSSSKFDSLNLDDDAIEDGSTSGFGSSGYGSSGSISFGSLAGESANAEPDVSAVDAGGYAEENAANENALKENAYDSSHERDAFADNGNHDDVASDEDSDSEAETEDGGDDDEDKASAPDKKPLSSLIAPIAVGIAFAGAVGWQGYNMFFASPEQASAPVQASFESAQPSSGKIVVAGGEEATKAEADVPVTAADPGAESHPDGAMPVLTEAGDAPSGASAPVAAQKTVEANAKSAPIEVQRPAPELAVARKPVDSGAGAGSVDAAMQQKEMRDVVVALAAAAKRIEAIESRMSKMENMLARAEKMVRESREARMVDTPAPGAGKSPSAIAPQAAIPGYSLTAAVSNMAWIKEPDGGLRTVTQGDSIKTGVVVVTIDPDLGVVHTTAGRIIQR